MEVSWKSVALFVLASFLIIQLAIHRQVASDENSAPFRLKCPERLEGVIGETVILLCATEPQTSVTRVEWLVNEGTEVHLYRNGHDVLDDQATAYKGRTSLFNQEVPKGNCSLKLTVKDSDAGTYHCSVSPVVSCSITLTVQKKGEQSNTARSKSSFDFKKATVFCIAVVCAVPVLLYVFFPRH